MFPTCSEVLEVIRSLGYEKCPKPQPGSETEKQPEQHDLPSATLKRDAERHAEHRDAGYGDPHADVCHVNRASSE